MSEQKSKFALVLDSNADEANKRPNLKGEFQIAGEAAATRLALWSGTDKNGRFYARGNATPPSLIAAATATVNDDAPKPAALDLNVGEVALFANTKATADNKQPTVYGFARRADGYIRLAGWDRGGSITGTAEPYRPEPEEKKPTPQARHTKG